MLARVSNRNIEVITRRANIFYYAVFPDEVVQLENGHNCDHGLEVRNILKTYPPTEPDVIFVI